MPRNLTFTLSIEEKFPATFEMTINGRVAQPLLAVCTLQKPHRQECLCDSNICPSSHADAWTSPANGIDSEATGNL